MAASSPSSVWKINTLGHNYHYDPLLKSNRGALNYINLPSNAALKLARSFPISTRNFHSTGRRRTTYRPLIVNASAEKSSKISIHQSYRVLEIVTFIWSLPGLFTRFFKKEEELLDEVEEDIIKTADVIKGGAKVVEEVAEGLEEMAEALEKAAKTIDKDAKKVDDIMDEVKEKTKAAHDELEDVVGSLQGSIEVVEKDVTKLRVKVKETKEESASIPNTTDTPPSKEEPRDPVIKNPNTLDYKPLQDLNLAWRSKTLLYGFLDALKWPLTHFHFQPPSSLMPLPTLLFGTMLMAFFLLGIGVMTTSTLII